MTKHEHELGGAAPKPKNEYFENIPSSGVQYKIFVNSHDVRLHSNQFDIATCALNLNLTSHKLRTSYNSAKRLSSCISGTKHVVPVPVIYRIRTMANFFFKNPKKQSCHCPTCILPLAPSGPLKADSPRMQ